MVGSVVQLAVCCDEQVTVVFHCSPSLLDHADQAGEDLPAQVSMSELPNGQKKLTFQQNLLIHYSNNSQQVGNSFHQW